MSFLRLAYYFTGGLRGEIEPSHILLPISGGMRQDARSELPEENFKNGGHLASCGHVPLYSVALWSSSVDSRSGLSGFHCSPVVKIALCYGKH